jgi:hypothetical protein
VARSRRSCTGGADGGPFYPTVCGQGVKGNHDWPEGTVFTDVNVCQTCVNISAKEVAEAIVALKDKYKCPWCGHPDRHEHGLQHCAHRIREERDALLLEKRKMVDALGKIHDLAGQVMGPEAHPNLGAIQDWVHKVLPCDKLKTELAPEVPLTREELKMLEDSTFKGPGVIQGLLEGKGMSDITKPTPGPWKISDRSPVLVIGYDQRLLPGTERVTIAKVDPGGDRLPVAVGDANARLIAEAPEMLALLVTLRASRIFEGCGKLGEKWAADIDSLVARVEGRKPEEKSC